MDTYIHDVNRKLSAKRAEYVHCSHRTLNIELCVRSVLCTKWTCFNSFDTFFLERHIYLYTRQWRKPSFTYGAFFFYYYYFDSNESELLVIVACRWWVCVLSLCVVWETQELNSALLQQRRLQTKCFGLWMMDAHILHWNAESAILTILAMS